MKRTLLALMLLASAFASASTNVQKGIDAITATGGTQLSVPLVGSSFLSDTNTVTVINKTLSGASNTFSNIPATAISSGQLAVANGGTGLSSGTSGGILGFTASGTLASSAALAANQLVLGGGAGATPSTLGSLGTTTTVLHGNAAGAPSFGAVSLTAEVSGTLPVANGGTGAATLTSGSVVVGNGTSAVSLVAPGSSGNVLTSNGSTWTSSAAASTAPTLTGTQASPLSVTAGAGVVLTSPTYTNVAFVVSNSGSVIVTATPSITACTAAGQSLRVIGESASNIITLQDEAGLPGSKLLLNGNWTSGLNTILTATCDGNGFWVESSRSN